MFKIRFIISLLVAIVISGLSGSLFAQNQVTIKPGPIDGKFTYLNSFLYVGRTDPHTIISTAWTYGGVFGIGRSFFSFDLPQLPAGATVLHASLNLYYDPIANCDGQSGENASKIERVITNWNENTMNWNNQPQVDPTNAVYLPTSTTTNQSYPDIDVTALVQAMYADPQNSFGFRISLLNENIYRSMIFASCNHADESIRPSLVIQYDSCNLPVDNFQYDLDGMACQFTYSDATTTEWQWNFGDNTTSTLQNPFHSYTNPGTYIVTLAATNVCGETTMSDTIVICNLPVDHFQYDLDGMACQFTYSDATTTEWHWNFGDNSSSNLQNPLHTYTHAGTYIVTLIAMNECGRTSMSDTITVCRKPVSDFTYRTDGQIVAFKSLATDAEAWYWSFGNGFFSNLENPVYHYLQTGTYEVCLLVTNHCGSDIHCEKLTIDDQTVTLAGGQQEEIETTPNPTSGQVQISANNDQVIYRIDVCNTSGLLVRSVEINSAASLIIDLSDVDAGAYIIKVVTSGGDFSKMIIKR